MTSPVRVRFAPSPTGYLHIGGARTALFNWLYAKHTGGTLVLRVEDTDRARNTEEAAQAIYDGLRWLGLDWDEGPHAGGNYGPYFQSQREEIYQSYLERLRAADRVYDDGGSVRFRFVREKVVVDDIICGHVEIDMSDPETNPDMTIRRPDGSWIFHFVNVVDDIEMKISHVIRGEDHLSNTPKHIQLYRAFGTAPPRFAHIPLILNKNGSKMSKRDQGASLDYYIRDGFLPEAVRNYLTLLGWSPKDNREKLNLAETIRLFDIDKIVRGHAVFDSTKLLWLNAEYMRSIDSERHFQLSIKRLLEEGFPVGFFEPTFLRHAIESSRGKIKTYAELRKYLEREIIPEMGLKLVGDVQDRVIFAPEDDFAYDVDAAEKYLTLANKPLLVIIRDVFAALPEFNADELEKSLKATAQQRNVKPATFVHPLRVAVSGKMVGPSLYRMLELRGKDRVIASIERAIREINRRPIVFKDS